MLNKIISILLVVATVASCNRVDYQDGVTIIFAGDVLLDRGTRPIIERRGTEYLFEGVTDYFKKADFTVINLECPITDNISPLNKKYIFRADKSNAQGLKNVGITHCAMANNHTVDQGFEGLSETNKNLREVGIATIGYKPKYDTTIIPEIVEKNGVRVAIYSVCVVAIENYVNRDSMPGISIAAIDRICRTIREFRSQNPNTYIVTFLHWGSEFQNHPSLLQRMNAKRIITSGADVLIGCHPHVIQDIDTIGNRLIYHSIGNFVFDQQYPEARRCLMPIITFGNDTIIHQVKELNIVRNRPQVRN